MISSLPSYKSIFYPTHLQCLKMVARQKVYTFKKTFELCCSSECKTYTLVIFGRLLQAAAIAATVTSLVFTFIVGPAALVGLIPSIAGFLIGHYIVQNNKLETGPCPEFPFLDRLFPTTFVPKQPIGLRNTGNTCWINAFMQCVMHVPVLRERALLIPRLATKVNEYLQLQKNAKSTSELNWRDLNDHLAEVVEERARAFRYAPELGEMNGGQADANLLFEWMFEQGPQDPLYTFIQTRTLISGIQNEPRPQPEGLIELDFPIYQSMPQLFNHFLDYVNEDDGSRIQKRFRELPQTLCFYLKRYKGEPDLTHPGRLKFTRIGSPVEGVDLEYALPREARPSDDAARYACEAFIVHEGHYMGGGHYVAYVKKEGKWWSCSDSRITPISDEDAKNRMKECYFFFYNKQN